MPSTFLKVIGTTRDIIVLVDAGRIYLLILNESGSTCYIGDSSVSTTSGIPLGVGQSAEFEGKEANDAIYGITSAGSAILRVAEKVV